MLLCVRRFTIRIVRNRGVLKRVIRSLYLPHYPIFPISRDGKWGLTFFDQQVSQLRSCLSLPSFPNSYCSDSRVYLMKSDSVHSFSCSSDSAFIFFPFEIGKFNNYGGSKTTDNAGPVEDEDGG